MKRHKYSGKRRAPPIIDPTASFREGLSGIISKAKAKAPKASLLHYKDNEDYRGGTIIYSGCSAFKGYTRARSWVRKDS